MRRATRSFLIGAATILAVAAIVVLLIMIVVWTKGIAAAVYVAGMIWFTIYVGEAERIARYGDGE